MEAREAEGEREEASAVEDKNHLVRTQILSGTTSAIRTLSGPFEAVGDVSGVLTSPTSDGSFSAVWTATIASKDAFCSIFRDLQDLHPFAPFSSRKVCKFASNFC